MTKTQIKKELMVWSEGSPFISMSVLKKALHLGNDSTRALVAGLPYIKNGKRKDFLIEDVAKRLLEKSSC